MTATRRTRGRAALLGIGLLLGLWGCGGGNGTEAEPRGEQTYQGAGDEGQARLDGHDEVMEALHRAETAFIKEQWGDAVVYAARVIEGDSLPEQHYAALKILGMAGCNRKDPMPIRTAWQRLLPPERQAMQRQCAQNGLRIAEDGSVTPLPSANTNSQ